MTESLLSAHRKSRVIAAPKLTSGAGRTKGNRLTAKEAFEHIRKGKFQIDFLMLVAAIGAAALGKWVEGGLLLFLFSLGHSLEHFAMAKARRAIESLSDLAPEEATENTRKLSFGDPDSRIRDSELDTLSTTRDP